MARFACCLGGARSVNSGADAKGRAPPETPKRVSGSGKDSARTGSAKISAAAPTRRDSVDAAAAAVPSSSAMDSVSVPIGWRAPDGSHPARAVSPVCELDSSHSESGTPGPQVTPEMIVYDFTNCNEAALATLKGWPADSRKPGQAHPPRGAVQLRHTPYTTRVDRELAALARAHAHRKPASPLAVCAAALCDFDHSPGTAPADLGVLQPAQEPTYAATPDRTQRMRHDEWRAAGGSTQSDGSSTPRSGSADSGAAAAATRGGGSAAGGELAVDFSDALRRSGVVATDSRLDLHSAVSRPPSPPTGWPLSDSPARRPLVEARGGVARFAESGGATRIPSISESESLSDSYASCAQLSSSDLPAAQPDPASLPAPLPPLASVATKRASLAAMPAFPRSPGPRPGHAVARERRASLAAEGAAPETSAIASRGANFDLPVRHRFSQLAGTPRASAAASPLQAGVAPFGADLHATPFSEARPTQLPPPSATDIHVSTAGAQTVRGGVVMGRRAVSPAATQPAPPANALADRKAPALARTSAWPGSDSAAQGTRFAPAQRLRAPQRPASAAAAVRRPWQPDAAAHGPRSAEARAPLGVDAALVPRGAQRRAALEGVFAK